MKEIYKRKSLRRLAAAVCAALVAGMFTLLPNAEALRGGVVMPILDAKDAAVSIATNGNVMDITSTAQDNLIKWVDFSISSGNTVDFHDKNYLNYVTGSAVSDIQGILKGTGNIYLVNPNGILIGDGATINVGNLYLSTKNLTDSQLADYSAATGALFKSDNAALGDVINMGKLNANSVTVEGKNITFKNVADVTSGSAANVKLTANSTGEIHIGMAAGTEATAVNYTQYKNVTLSVPTGWTINKGANDAMYMLVRNGYELQNMQNNLSGKYMLAKDIDMSGVNFTPVGYSVFNHETGGYDEDTYAFKGRFDGLGYAVKNLSVNFNYTFDPEIDGTSQSGIGLFGWNKGTVENVKLSGGSIESTQGSIGIIGINDGTVRNVFNDGVTVMGTYCVGGIVGDNSTGTIKNVWNTGTVSGSSRVGGIAGNNHYGASIENAWNNGSVSGSENSVGGIVGNNQDGIVQNVYNTGAVQSGSYGVGGIVGVNQGNSTNTIVQYAYNTGNVASSNSNKVGGIVGSNYAIIRNAYSQEGTAAAVSGESSPSATENDVAIKSETDLKKAATFAGFGFENGVSSDGAWRIYEEQTMPLLTAFLTRKDNITNTTVEYNGTTTGDVGARYAATTYSGVEAQLGGTNYVSDVSFVTPKDLTVSFADISKTYDGTTEATPGAETLAGKVEGDDVSLDTANLAAAYADKNAGANKTVNYTGLALTGDKAKNYNLVNAATATGTGTITAKEISATFADISKTYDGTTNATAGAGTLTGVVAGDTGKVSVSGLAAYDTKNAGTSTVNYTNVALSGAEAANYTIADTATGSGTITAKELSATFADIAKTYDGTTNATAGQGTLAGVVASDEGKVSVSGLAAYDTKNAGTRTVNYTNVALSGAEAANYTIADTATGSGTITAKELSATFADIAKTYDGTTNATAGQGTLAGVVDGDTGKVSVSGLAAYDTKNAGTRTVNYTNVALSGAEAANYIIADTATGSGTISKADVKISVDNYSRAYDGTTDASGATLKTVDGAIFAGDTLSGGTLAFTDKNAGTGKTITVADVTVNDGNGGNNYNVTYEAGTGTITAKEITATFADIAKTYDGTTNATAGQGMLAGVVASDEGKVSVSCLAAYDTKNAGTRTVNYTNVALSGAEAANYTIADTATGSGTINKADVKISVDNYSRAYDGTTDASGATLKTVDGAIFAGDTLSGGTLAFTDKNAGTGKTITVSDVTVNDGNGGNNYNVTYQEGTGEITRRPLSLTANPVSITQGEAVPASFSGTLTGFAEGEGLAEGDSYAFNLSGTPTAVGKYAIMGTLSIGDNDPAESGDYGTNYTFANAAANATAFTIAAKYVPPAPTPTPSAPSGGSGSTTPTNPTTPTEPTPIAPSGNTDSTTPKSGGNTSGTGANTPIPLAAAERVIVATVTETETIAAAATAGATAEMTHIADNVRPTNIAEQPTNSGENAAAAPLAAAVETAANAQDFTLTAGGLLAVSNETNSAPKDAMSVESIGHALSALQHGSGEKSAATAPNTETKSAAGSIGSLEEAVEATDLAIGTEIAETDRESKAGQENLASDTGTAGGADESAEESDEKKKR